MESREFDLVVYKTALEEGEPTAETLGSIALHGAPVFLAHLDAAEIAVGFRRSGIEGTFLFGAGCSIELNAIENAEARV